MTADPFGARVLVVAGDPAVRRLLRVGLETDGFFVLEAVTRRLAVRLLRLRPEAVVVSPSLPDGDASPLLAQVRSACPEATLVLHTPPGEPPLDASLLQVAEGDVAALLDLLAPLRRRHARAALLAPAVVTAEIDAIASHWVELCRWDPMLPPESEPILAGTIIKAIGSASAHPQPLGWGPDPELEHAVAEFTAAAGPTEVAIEQLVCLREALMSCTLGRVPKTEVDETRARLNMLVDRAIGLAARQSASRLEAEAYTDPLTGLANRRGFDRDLRRELHRADRYERPLTLAVIDVIGLKTVNDRDGHLAGDLLLRSLGSALLQALRHSDGAYRLGGDEFALILPETDADAASVIISRIREHGPEFSWGTATLPADGRDPVALVDLADRRLYEQRAGERGPS